MRLVALLALLGCACGQVAVEEFPLRIETRALSPGDVGSVLVLVLGGERATCDRVRATMDPLDDPELEILRHALFTADGTAKRLSVPADVPLVFYAQAFRSPDGKRPAIGTGCVETTLPAGKSTGVSIIITGP
jgi:hypothetical protein